jgi:hypothetical protein
MAMMAVEAAVVARKRRRVSVRSRMIQVLPGFPARAVPVLLRPLWGGPAYARIWKEA